MNFLSEKEVLYTERVLCKRSECMLVFYEDGLVLSEKYQTLAYN